jgi:hypothetical protein
MTGEGCIASSAAYSAQICRQSVDSGVARLGVDCSDGGLQRIRSEAARHQGALDQRDALANQRLIPRRPVLLLEQHELALGADTGGASRFMQEHERNQADHLRLR